MKFTKDILPLGWTKQPTDFGSEYFAVISPGCNAIHLTVVEDQEEGAVTWAAELHDGTTAEGSGDNVQDCADQAAEFAANWMLEDASPRELIEIAGGSIADTKARQVELATVLGVNQSAISRWATDDQAMTKAVRTHIMRIVSLRRTPGADAKWAVFG